MSPVLSHLFSHVWKILNLRPIIWIYYPMIHIITCQHLCIITESSKRPTFTPICKAKRQYLLTLQVSRYCLLAMHGSLRVIVIHCTTDDPVFSSPLFPSPVCHEVTVNVIRHPPPPLRPGLDDGPWLGGCRGNVFQNSPSGLCMPLTQ